MNVDQSGAKLRILDGSAHESESTMASSAQIFLVSRENRETWDGVHSSILYWFFYWIDCVSIWSIFKTSPRRTGLVGNFPHSTLLRPPGTFDLWTPSQVSCFSLLTGMSEPKTPSCFHFHGRRHLEFLRFHGRWIDSVWKSRSYAVALKENPFNVYIFWQLNSYRIQLYLWNFLNSQYRR